MEEKSTNRILLIVGFLTVLFLFREYSTSNVIPELEVFGFTLKFESIWFINTLTFAVTLFLFAFASIGLLWRWSTIGGYVFYVISVLIIPCFFLAHIVKAFVGFQDQHMAYFRVGGLIVCLGILITFIIWLKRR